MKRRILASWIVVLVALVSFASAQEKKPPVITYADDVQPLLRAKCFSCHNPDKKSGDLDLTNYGSLMTGGGSGEVV
ncbi:MAG: c-type cytochrome domain-containing protein, partial [Planctomycetota bacterium]